MVKYKIKFKNRDEFEKFTEIGIADSVEDIGYSDMVLSFGNENDMLEMEKCIIMNHIRPKDFNMLIDGGKVNE